VDKKEVKVTTSIGVGSFEQNNLEDYQDLINSTDQLLYRAKENGRNQVQYSQAGKSNTKKLNLVS
jgi:diguanylate cyclase (GGDEF)-like protein